MGGQGGCQTVALQSEWKSPLKRYVGHPPGAPGSLDRKGDASPDHVEEMATVERKTTSQPDNGRLLA